MNYERFVYGAKVRLTDGMFSRNETEKRRLFPMGKEKLTASIWYEYPPSFTHNIWFLFFNTHDFAGGHSENHEDA